MTYLPVLEYTRGDLVEAWHIGAIAVADAQGRLIASHGDPHAVTFLRSSAKPFQAIPLVESGAAAAFGLTAREIALACASHTAQSFHVETVGAMQAKIGVSEADLLCGAHPLDPAESGETFEQLFNAGEAPTPNYNNCSGKHTGMLAAAKHYGWPLADYVHPRHPLQQAILQTLAETCGLSVEAVRLGVDGCSAPNFAVPLVNSATAFARLAAPHEFSPPRAAALRTIFAAISAHPEMVRGPGGFDTELMSLRPGQIVSKGGAEGFQGIALAPGALEPGSPALGVALKLADGAARPGAVALAATEVLRQLGALTEADTRALARLGFGLPQQRRNWRGLLIGEARACFELTRTRAARVN